MLTRSKFNEKYEVMQSNGECCYVDILKRFNCSSKIYVMMFNDFKRNLEVAKLLDRLSTEVKVNFISDIESKYTTSPKEYKNIDDELSFDSHSKIIMTDELVYLGTANHPSEGNDFECGFMISDIKMIERIKEKLFKEKSDLITMYTEEFIDLVIIFMNYYAKVNRILENIVCGAFIEDSKGVGYYNENTAKINFSDLEFLIEVVVEYNKKLSEIENKKLKEVLGKVNNIENLEALEYLCNKDGKMKELSKLEDTKGEERRLLSVDSEEEILDLYERVALFSEELYAVIEKMVEA